MKLVISLLVITAFSSAIPMARAQEEETAASPAPATEEQTTSTAVEAPSTPAETSPVTMPEKSAPVTAASPSKKEQPAASASPAAEKKKTAAAESTSKTAAAKMSSGPDTGSPESNVKRLENEWENSVMKHDVSFAQARVADDYMGCSSKGKRLNKAALIKEIKSDADTYTSAKNGSMTVHSYGPNVAVALGTSKEVGTSKDGKAFTRTYSWTDTWMLRGSRWQCIASETMLVSGK